MKQTHVSRAGRKAMIIMNVFDRTAGDTMPICTRYSIAKGIGLAPSTHVKKIVDELVQDGWLNEHEVTDLWGRKSTRLWLVKDANELLRDTVFSGNYNLKFVKAWFEQ